MHKIACNDPAFKCSFPALLAALEVEKGEAGVARGLIDEQVTRKAWHWTGSPLVLT